MVDLRLKVFNKKSRGNGLTLLVLSLRLIPLFGQPIHVKERWVNLLINSVGTGNITSRTVTNKLIPITKYFLYGTKLGSVSRRSVDLYLSPDRPTFDDTQGSRPSLQSVPASGRGRGDDWGGTRIRFCLEPKKIHSSNLPREFTSLIFQIFNIVKEVRGLS